MEFVRIEIILVCNFVCSWHREPCHKILLECDYDGAIVEMRVGRSHVAVPATHYELYCMVFIPDKREMDILNVYVDNILCHFPLIMMKRIFSSKQMDHSHELMMIISRISCSLLIPRHKWAWKYT